MVPNAGGRAWGEAAQGVPFVTGQYLPVTPSQRITATNVPGFDEEPENTAEIQKGLHCLCTISQ